MARLVEQLVREAKKVEAMNQSRPAPNPHGRREKGVANGFPVQAEAQER